MFSATKPPSVNIWQADRVDFYKSVFHRYLLSLCNVSFALYLRDASIFQLKNVLLEMQKLTKIKQIKTNPYMHEMGPWKPKNYIFSHIFLQNSIKCYLFLQLHARKNVN